MALFADNCFPPSGPLSTARFGWPDLAAYRPGVQAPPEERGLPGLRGIVGLSAWARDGLAAC